MKKKKKNQMQDQIQSLLISKINFFQKKLQLKLNTEIDRVKNWNSSFNCFGGKAGNNTDLNFSNIRLSMRYNENDSFENSKKNISQDYFDFSISNQFLNLNNFTSNNYGNNINININQSPKFVFTNNKHNSSKANANNSFANIDCEGENILESNSNNIHINTNPSNNNTNSMNNFNRIINNDKVSGNRNNKNFNNQNLIFNKEEHQEINNCYLNNLNYNSNTGIYNSNNREERIKSDSIKNLISNGNNNKNVLLTSNYNSNSNNLYDSFLQSAKGPSTIIL